MKGKFDYRAFYEEKTNEKVPKSFDVHHIDFNRENNRIENLVAIPRIVHKNYHDTYFFNNSQIRIDVSSNPLSYMHILEMVNIHSECSSIIHYYILFREKLINKNPVPDTSYNYEKDFSNFKKITNE